MWKNFILVFVTLFKCFKWWNKVIVKITMWLDTFFSDNFCVSLSFSSVTTLIPSLDYHSYVVMRGAMVSVMHILPFKPYLSLFGALVWILEGFLYPPATFQSTIFDRLTKIEDPYTPILKKNCLRTSCIVKSIFLGSF